MRVLVTGGSGFLGRNFLLATPSDWDVDATYLHDETFPAFLAAHGLDHVRPLRVDLVNGAGAAAALARAYDRGLFLAANVDIPRSIADPALDLDANARTVLNVLSAIECERLVFLSSGAVYDGMKGVVLRDRVLTPRIPYAISKLAAELYVRYFEHRRGSVGTSVILRFFGAFGPWEPPRKIYTKLVKALAIERRSAFTIVGDGQNLIDAMYVDDAGDGMMRCLVSQSESVTVDFASGHPISINDLVLEAGVTFGTPVEICHTGFTEEYIEFRAEARGMADLFGFTPRVELRDGLLRFRDHLVGRAR